MTTITDCLKTVAGRRILYVMATEQEYRDHLKRRFTPFQTHVGPVESALRLGIGLQALAERDSLPDVVVSIGSAGSAVLRHGVVYQVSSIVYRDMDASVLGFPVGETPFLGLPAVLDLPLRVPDMPEASLSTGADIVTGNDYDRIDAEMVDMESYAHLRAAMMFDVPLIGLRGISDGRDDLVETTSWEATLPLIDERLGEAVDLLEASIGNGLLSG